MCENNENWTANRCIFSFDGDLFSSHQLCYKMNYDNKMKTISKSWIINSGLTTH